jgi:hypothetical protein
VIGFPVALAVGDGLGLALDGVAAGDAVGHALAVGVGAGQLVDAGVAEGAGVEGGGITMPIASAIGSLAGVGLGVGDAVGTGVAYAGLEAGHGLAHPAAAVGDGLGLSPPPVPRSGSVLPPLSVGVGVGVGVEPGLALAAGDAHGVAAWTTARPARATTTAEIKKIQSPIPRRFDMPSPLCSVPGGRDGPSSPARRSSHR